jgi:hypothetical protein
LEPDVVLWKVARSIGGYFYSGTDRPDVCAAYPNRPKCPNVGWSYLLDTTNLANGVHILTAVAVTNVGGQATASATFNVQNANGADSTRLYIDTPNGQSGALSGPSTIAGWATHNDVNVGTITVSI